MKAKEWLLKQGLIAEIARGRISLANHEALRKAAESGVEFSDWPKGKVETVIRKTASDTGAVAITEQVTRVIRNKDTTAGKVIEEIAPYRFTEDTHEVWEETASGKRVKRSLKEVCQYCRVSLVQDICDLAGRNPSIVSATQMGHVDVTIVRRK